MDKLFRIQANSAKNYRLRTAGFKSHVKTFTSFVSVLLGNIYTVHLTELAIFGTAEAQLLGSTVSPNT